MEEGTYKITPSILEEIINYGICHPEKHFCCDELTDSTGDFLSCCFIKDDENGYPIWELDGIEEEDK